MIELLIEPFKLFLSKGVDQFLRSNELKNLRLSYIDRLMREIKFNKAILDEIVSGEDLNKEEKIALVACLRTSAFDALNESPLPTRLIISGELQKEEWRKFSNGKAIFLQRLEKVLTIQELLDRVYYRIHVVKTLEPHSQKNRDYAYINFMLSCLDNALKQLEGTSK